MPNNTEMSTASNGSHSDKLTLQEALSSPAVVVFCLLLIFLLILILVGNFTVMRTVHMTPKLHYSAFYFVFSLALADCMVGFLVPFSIAYIIARKMTNGWASGEIACDIWTFSLIWLIEASLLNLCMVSWDRYVAVTSPFNYKLRMRGKKVRVLIVLVWSLSFIIGVLYTLAFKFSKERELCKVNGISLKLTISFFTVVYAVPSLFLLFVNTRVIMVARRHRRHIGEQEIKPTWITDGESDMEIKNDQRKVVFLNEIKTFKTFVVIIGTFLLCYSPFFILLLMCRYTPISTGTSHAALILFYVKSGLNPMIYGASKDLRVAAANSLKRRRIATDITDAEKSTPKASVLRVPAEEERYRAPSPLKIDDIIPKDQSIT